jgi:hypothetical protein
MTNKQKALLVKIKTKGNNEQEKQYLFPSLYGDKALTKREAGAWKQLENHLNSNTFRL